MFDRKNLSRLLWTALLALTSGAATTLGTSLMGFIIWWLANH